MCSQAHVVQPSFWLYNIHVVGYNGEFMDAGIVGIGSFGWRQSQGEV